MKTFISDLSNKEFPIGERVSGKSIRQSIMQLIEKDHPDFNKNKYIANSELDFYREKHIELLMKKHVSKITKTEKQVMSSLKEKKTISDISESEENSKLSFGQKLADKVADFGGSWTFIISFMIFISIWIGINAFWLANIRFDPYPFILLNLILSSLAALQAPVIMMSQNRQEEKDRERAKQDYMVNLKAELEIEMLHEKIDHLIINQQQEMIEVHKTQLEVLDKILTYVENIPQK